MNTLNGKIAVITGGSRGIGYAAAKALHAHGASVILTGRDETKLKGAVAELGNRTEYAVFDVSDGAAVQEFFSSVFDRFGSVDILVNNAGIAIFAGADEFNIDDWNRVIGVNLTGALMCSQAVIPKMLEKGSGSIINICSTASVKAFPGCSAYGASKAGLYMLTKVMRKELRGRGIRVSAVLPGATATDIWDGIGGDFDRDSMISPDVVGEAIANICLVPDTAIIEDLVIRPAGGDL